MSQFGSASDNAHFPRGVEPPTRMDLQGGFSVRDEMLRNTAQGGFLFLCQAYKESFKAPRLNVDRYDSLYSRRLVRLGSNGVNNEDGPTDEQADALANAYRGDVDAFRAHAATSTTRVEQLGVIYKRFEQYNVKAHGSAGHTGNQHMGGGEQVRALSYPPSSACSTAEQASLTRAYACPATLLCGSLHCSPRTGGHPPLPPPDQLHQVCGRGGRHALWLLERALLPGHARTGLCRRETVGADQPDLGGQRDRSKPCSTLGKRQRASGAAAERRRCAEHPCCCSRGWRWCDAGRSRHRAESPCGAG